MKKHILAILPLLSLIVILGVFWWLKLTGITLAGEAFCGFDEHSHNEECVKLSLVCEDDHDHTESCYEITQICQLDEHIHNSSCYSDITADIESAEDWEQTIANVPPGITAGDTVSKIAASQLGYTESELNFIVDSGGIRHGYTRYGEWFGNQYGDWSTMFTSFCLRYGGLDGVPISAGAESMRLQWEESNLYKAQDNYIPSAGDIVFLDKNLNGTADTTAVVTGIADGQLTVIEGDLENTVAETNYSIFDQTIQGYGTIAPKNNVQTMDVPLSYASGQYSIAQTQNFNTSIFTQGSSFVLYTQGTDGKYYALSGSGNAVEVFIDSQGYITTNNSGASLLYWTFESATSYDYRPTYYIYNSTAGRYLHPYVNGGEHGALLTGKWESTLYQNGTGVKIRGARQNSYAFLQNNSTFTNITNQSSASTFYFGRTFPQYAVWFDGTCGGVNRSLAGSPNTAYFVTQGDTLKLPETWQSPTKYEYKIRGWFDVAGGKYYAPGDEITVNGHMVFYPDWVPATYDIGFYNEYTHPTESTNNFVTTKLFDYNALINANSSTVSVSVDANGHNETWTLATNGTGASGYDALGVVFVDYDANGDITYVNNRGTINTNQDGVTTNIYNTRLIEMLFGEDNLINPDTGQGVLGKSYLGTGDYLFRFDDDPDSPHYGYYFYDSKMNATSYNQSDQRFYVYDYLECTVDSLRDGGLGGYSDFLPFNSPYANTNGQAIRRYNYDGDDGEFAGKGIQHYAYDSSYSDNNNSADRVVSNYWYGMDIEIEFYLPDDPGDNGNHDIYGNEMHFHFSGDDDVWILIDGQLVLDIGGIHDIMIGDINFSTGVITQGGNVVGNLTDYGIESGEHTLTVYYLERGSSKSNCELYFNLAPRFDFEIRKEDVLTQEVLNGAEFSVYLDKECTIPAQLWTSKEAYENGEGSKNVFTVTDGLAHMWGMTSGKIYYIKETEPPDAENYSLANGIICLTLDHKGYASYTVDIIEDYTGTVSPGFTVHGLKVDVDKQEAYVVVTNAEDWVREVTSVGISKKWNDSADHSKDLPIFYLLVKDPDGTYRRIREIRLGEDNDWKYTWTNLPKYYVDKDGNTTEIIEYIVEEAYLPGYTSKVEKVEKTPGGDKSWAEAYQFESGEKYVLSSQYGALSTSNSNSCLIWVDTETAKNSPYALWTATVSTDGTVTFKNDADQYLHLSYRGEIVSASIFTTVTDNNHITMRYEQANNQGVRIYHDYGESWNNTRYYIGSNVLEYNGIYAAEQAAAVIFKPLVEKEEEILVSDGTFVYKATNTPIPPDNLTSVTVNKNWDMGVNPSRIHNTYQIPVRLYSNGVYTGRTEILSLQNGWSVTFEGLPFRDDNGNTIIYSVQEEFNESGWEIVYGDMNHVAGTPGSYNTLITNRNNAGYGVELPSTGSYGYPPWLVSGYVLMLGSLLTGCILRHKRERRKKKPPA